MKGFCLTTFFVFVVILSCVHLGFSQDKKVTLSGYIKDLFYYYQPRTKYPEIDNEFFYSKVIHNRLNFRWYADDHLTFAVEVRNRFIGGSLVMDLPFYEPTETSDPGYFDLSKVWISEDSWFLHTIVDRAWMEYAQGRWQITIGRQRINWGMNLIWNPNDLFNTYSYFDFDYEERYGSDAVRIKYFPGATSSAEVAFKAGHTSEENIFAGLYRFSAWNYDIQFLAGQAGTDYVVGSGWSGNINGAGFRGEVTWFIPQNGEKESRESLIACVSGDYTFRNNLYVHGGFLYNSFVETRSTGFSLFDLSLSVKYMSLSNYAIFMQTSYPVTPLFKLSATSFINTVDGSFYVGPAINWSISENIELMFSGQLFFGDNNTEYGDTGKAIFTRFKWAF